MYRPQIENRVYSDDWITAFDADEIMEIEDVTGIAIRSTNFTGFEQIGGGREGGKNRYEHLFMAVPR